MVKHLVVTKEDELLILDALRHAEWSTETQMDSYQVYHPTMDSSEQDMFNRMTKKRDRIREIINTIENATRTASV